MNIHFEYITNLEYKVKGLEARIAAFESGKKYLKMKEDFKRQLAKKEAKNRKLKHELADARTQNVATRNRFLEVNEDLQREYEKKLQKKEHQIETLKQHVQKLQTKNSETQITIRLLKTEMDKIIAELKDAKENNAKLLFQMNRDYENSSLPSSAKPKKKKIHNSREKTGRSPGGQPGHKGHRRKKHIPTRTIPIPVPEKFTDSTLYAPTGRTITKQLVNLILNIDVVEFTALEYRKKATGQRVHAKFPPGVINDVNYGGSVKAFLFLLTNYCNVSIDKASDLLYELSYGKLRISKGMINNLNKEFSEKTEGIRKKAFADLQQSPVMHTDFTGARVNGEGAQVCICATKKVALYHARKHKGHKGVEGTPVDGYQGILVHDHDLTFYNHGSAHQECNEHPSRDLLAIMENEPKREWPAMMRALLREAMRYQTKLPDGAKLNPNKVKKLEKKYLEALKVARREYENDPPSEYSKEGYNLYRRLEKYRDNHLLFLHNQNVPPDNNLAERLLRVFKRKQHQAMAFRSFEGFTYTCNAMSVIALLRMGGKNLYQSVSEVF